MKINFKYPLLILLATLWFAGCGAFTPQVAIDREIELFKGDTVRLEGTNIKIEFLFTNKLFLQDNTEIYEASFMIHEGRKETKVYLELSGPNSKTIYSDYEIELLSTNVYGDAPSLIMITKTGTN